MTRARVLVLRTAGTNCDEETAWAFRLAGAEPEVVPLGRLLGGGRDLEEFDALVFPGGFSFGDDLGAGTVLAGRLRAHLAGSLADFVASGRPVLGICNGFQVLVRLGILPGWGGGQEASLVENVSGRFEDRWTRLRILPEASRCPWLAFAAGAGGGGTPVTVRAPVAHREGRFVLRDADGLERLRGAGQVACTYATDDGTADAAGAYPANPNGSVGDIAGICNPEGNVLGLMPHPERFVHRLHDPLWTRAGRPEIDRTAEDLARAGEAFPVFASAVEWIRSGGAAARA